MGALHGTGKDVEIAGGRMDSLEKDLTCARGDVSKLRETLDLTQEYWKGLTKGFRQTHRSVAVENEMFSSKGAIGTTLPALTKTVSPHGSPGSVSARLMNC